LQTDLVEHDESNKQNIVRHRRDLSCRGPRHSSNRFDVS